MLTNWAKFSVRLLSQGSWFLVVVHVAPAIASVRSSLSRHSVHVDPTDEARIFTNTETRNSTALNLTR